MGRYRMPLYSFHIFIVIAACLTVFSADCPAKEIKFTDWVGVEETDPSTNKISRQIGTYAQDGISALWISDPDRGDETIELTLKSEKPIASEYFYYRIDSVDTLTIRSAVKGCESKCLTDFVSRNGELIKTMKGGLVIRFEYDVYPDNAQKPAFSLRGFTRACKWLLTE